MDRHVVRGAAMARPGPWRRPPRDPRGEGLRTFGGRDCAVLPGGPLWGSGGEGTRSCAVGLGGVAIGGELTGVIEDDDTVAEQAPTLLGMRRHDTCRRVIERGRRGAWRPVLAHVTSPFLLDPLGYNTTIARQMPEVSAATPQITRLPAAARAFRLAGITQCHTPVARRSPVGPKTPCIFARTAL